MSMGAITGAGGGGRTAPRLTHSLLMPRHFWAAAADTHRMFDEPLWDWCVEQQERGLGAQQDGVPSAWQQQH